MPSRARVCDGAAVMSAPSKVTRPAEARMMPISVFKSVVLPMPLWPSTPTNSPAATANDTPFSTWMRPYPAESSPTVSMASLSPRRRPGPISPLARAATMSLSATNRAGVGMGPGLRRGDEEGVVGSPSRRLVPAEIDVAHHGIGHDLLEGFLDQD